MPKLSTLPTVYDYTSQLTIKKVKEWGFIEPNQILSGVATYRVRGEVRNSISLRSDTTGDIPFIELSYLWRQKSICYKIELTSIDSNIGNGKIWFFVCPRTGKRCRKLYLIDGYYLHRDAASNGIYESQRMSKNYREICKVIPNGQELDDWIKEMNSKHFKEYYKGKPTKRHVWLNKKINQYANVDPGVVERALLFGKI